jgi:hypothetical protein
VSTAPPAPVTTLEGLLVGVLALQNPEVLDMVLATDDDAFLGVAERGLLRCIRTIESGAKVYGALREVGLSKMLADMLSLAGFKAEAEAYNNGHVDVTIRHFDPAKFSYLGECKIHKGYTHHRSGCKQVLGYGSGREPRVFSLDFFKTERMYPKLAAIRARFDKERALKQRGKSRDHFITGAFLTTHPHRTAGTDVVVLHVGCNLHVAGTPKKLARVAIAPKKLAKAAGAKPPRPGGKATKKRRTGS